MRIAVFTSQYPGRTCTFFARDMRGLLDAGVELEVFAIYPLDPDLWRFVPAVLGDDILPRERIHHLGLGRSMWPSLRGYGTRFGPAVRDSLGLSLAAARDGIGPLAKTVYVLPKAWTWARQFRGRFDHVVAYWANFSASCALVFHRLAAPDKPFSIFLQAGTDLYRTPGYLRQKLIYADDVFVPCEFNREFVLERYPEIREMVAAKTHVYHPGLDLQELGFLEGGRHRARILAVGRLDRLKGFDDLLRAAARLREQGLAFEVHLIGDGPEARRLRELAGHLRLADRVVFRGWLRFDDVRRAMGEATILAHPSSGLGDAVPNVIKEAMAVGLPVVASDVAGIPELLDHGRCGVLVPPREPERLADAIAGLLADEGRRRDLARAGRAFAEETFDLWRNGRRLAQTLRSTRRATNGEVA